MNKKENRPLLEQEAGQDKGNTSMDHYSSVQGEKQQIFDFLPQGEANAIRTSELVRLTGVRSARDLQNKIAAERESGYIILSSCRNGGGYYRPSDGQEGQREIAAFIQTLRARALNTLKVLKTARKALEGAEGQITLDELEVL